MRLHAVEVGDGSTPIVLLHGFGADHTAWRRIQPELAKATLAVAYDLPGHGGSLDFAGAGPAKNAAVAVINDLKGRAIERVHLVGHSMGGAVACLVALFEPSLVASLTLLSPGGFGPDINHRLLTRYAAADSEEQITFCLEAMTGWYSGVDPEVVRHLVKVRARAEQRLKLIEIAEGLAKDGRQGQLPLDKLGALRIVTSVVWGELDNVLPVKQLQGLPDSFKVHRCSELGHMLPDEAPGEMTRIILETCGF
ncbi:alpha/beta fold hydrolase [Aquamicrobium zhengzhouense]|uniref:Alpha/beta fold hydrolase n=1 Tax=Aquamicrobium zhengzhouense TaxID=2781738 RepID=A0ABS0SBM9_9HYPH|nr:alpha/beta fold hydrolase [Aquamicrobium zhengzhouense]MBI1619907.1 alpha/beta fold hydrolase [Aquamicrobium zhengzhouense]